MKGISGGIDSSVSSTLCALTTRRTIILSMPIKQNKDQYDLSVSHANWLSKKFKNVEMETVNLENIFNEFQKSLNKFNNDSHSENSRARIRMTTLYQVAVCKQWYCCGNRK